MEKVISETLDKVYKQKDTKFYLEKCREKFELPVQAAYVFKKFKFLYKQSENNLWPSVKFNLKFGDFQKDSFKVKYTGSLVFSKLVKAYALEFYYEIVNPDPEKYAPEFTGGNDEPVTILQANFQDELTTSLMKLGYKRMLINEREEVLKEVNFSSPNEFFQGPVQLWTALTHDVLDLTEDQ